MSTDFWNERYGKSGVAYGDAPNEFLAAVAPRLPRSGSALDIGAGEGRNALFLASLGLDALAVDQSDAGMRKAARLAEDRKLQLRTLVGDLRDLEMPSNSLDVVTSIFVHLPRELRETLHARIVGWLRPGGFFVLEAYSPEQLTRNTGGPRDAALLASLDTLCAELAPLTFEHRLALVRNVTEGEFHSGDASVVQIVARKPAHHTPRATDPASGSVR